MKNLHERLTKNLGRRLLIGVFFIFLGMVPAIYVWSCSPSNKPSTPIPPTPTPISVSNINFNINNDYLYDYSKQYVEDVFKVSKYISLNDNQYIYYDNENKINFINTEGKIIPIENQKIAKAVGQFNNKNVIILVNNNKYKFAFIDDKNIEYININSFDLDFNKPFFISQSSKTTFNLVYNSKNGYKKLLQYNNLTKNIYIHNLFWKEIQLKDIYTTYQNGIIIMYIYYDNKLSNKSWITISNNSIVETNENYVLDEKEIYLINDVFFSAFYINSKPYNYADIDKNKIKILIYGKEKGWIGIYVINKVQPITYLDTNNKKFNQYNSGPYIAIFSSNKTNFKEIGYFGDLLSDNYKYDFYNNSQTQDKFKDYTIFSENKPYIADFSKNYLTLRYYDENSKNINNLEFKNINNIINLDNNKINNNVFYIYQGNYYFNIYENNTLKVFTNDNNIANINIDKYKITRYKNNLVVLTKDKCLLLNLDSKNTTEFDLKDFDFDNSNSEFINANFDKNNILFKNADTVSLFVFNI